MYQAVGLQEKGMTADDDDETRAQQARVHHFWIGTLVAAVQVSLIVMVMMWACFCCVSTSKSEGTQVGCVHAAAAVYTSPRETRAVL